MSNTRDSKTTAPSPSGAGTDRAAGKIAELKSILSAVMENYPGLVFAKSADTGIYIACNQAFADYAHKQSPAQVVGLTDAQIFDAKTAAHFVEDDRNALSMDEPYVFYEDVPDAAGNPKRFETQKQKFIDETGQVRLLGLCRDVTEFVRIRRESESNRVAYERAQESKIIYTRIAQALARGYTDLYYVNVQTGEFIEYRTDGGSDMLAEERRGENFFERCLAAINQLVHPEDRAALSAAMSRSSLTQALDRSEAFVMTYRQLSPHHGSNYFTMKVSRLEDDERFIIIGVMNVDEQVRERRAVELAKEQRIAYARLNALSQDFLCLYIVDPESGDYREFSSSEEFASFALAKKGADFFGSARDKSNFVYPDDLERFLSGFSKEQVLAEIARSGRFMLSYRLMMNGKPNYIQLKAAMVNEPEGRRLVVGILDIDSSVRQEQEYSMRLAQAQTKANYDALTGVRNNHAYRDIEDRLNTEIAQNRHPEFALTILDVNDLKRINDSLGHQAGDRFLCDACRIICDIFEHSAVFRFGGDEFVAISQGRDFDRIDELVEAMRQHNEKAILTGGISIACGMARYEGDARVTSVFERADIRMYENKKDLKARTVR